MSIVYLNGRYQPIESACVPVLDRGFIFGDGVYEVIPVYNRRPFRQDDHLRRLQHSLDAIRLTNPHTPEIWASLIAPIIEQADTEDQGIYLQVTRGPAPRDQAIPAHVTPTVFIMAMPLPAPGQDAIEHGVAAVTAVDDRWLHCDIKSTSLLANVLLRQLSMDAGCAETLLIRNGFVTEGSASNIFIVTEGQVVAPPKSNLILPGVTYDVVLELTDQVGQPCFIRAISEAELRSADEVWITSSTKEITAVTRLDGQLVADGRPGPVYRRFHYAYQDYKLKVMRGMGNT
jgi:D-alanine transaminase